MPKFHTFHRTFQSDVYSWKHPKLEKELKSFTYKYYQEDFITQSIVLRT